ncbi:MAG: FAD-dependent oxidoreductase, partial [Verrucomicrobiaceae bacterium]|nr:FAD-dependent oxidoreductase [Verrucomicrobiaceae bacterium]
GTDMYGASYGWPEGDYATRDRFFNLHKDYTLGLLWFLGHDERLPIEVRTEMQRWGLAKDEFADTGHFPHQIYVREARRMISDYVITEHDAKSGKHAEDGVALASYPLDSHGVTLYVNEEGALHRERGFFVGGFSAFPISYRSLRPKAKECENLLVVSCLSASHAAYGSVRMEPVFMMVGHAAGAAASIAVNQNTTVQAVPYAALREQLLKEKQILEGKAVAPKPVAEPVSTTPPNEQLIADVQRLVDLKIIDEANYWLANSRKGKTCDGALVAKLLTAMAKHLDASSTDTFQTLITKKVFASPAYWQEHAQADRKCSGDNVRAVIRNFARAAK